MVSQDGDITAVREGKAVVFGLTAWRDEKVFDEAAIEVRAEQDMVRAESMQLKQTAMNLSLGVKPPPSKLRYCPKPLRKKGCGTPSFPGPEIVTLHHDGTADRQSGGHRQDSVSPAWITRNWCAMSPFLSPLILSPAR